jgi:hypothetical protein
LDRLAVVAAAQPQFAPGPGQYLYTKSTSDYAIFAGRCVLHNPYTLEMWIGADGSGVQRSDSKSVPTLFDPREARACAHMLKQLRSSVGVSETVFAARCLVLGPVDLQRLPTNVTKLRRELVSGRIEGGPPGAGQDFVTVGDLLTLTDASPALRAALYKVASTLPGVQLLGRVRDPVGREGLGLAIDDRGLRDELIFNPTTSALLAEKQTVISKSSGYPAPNGALASQAVYLRSAIVDSLPPGTPKLHPPCAANGSGFGHSRGPHLSTVTGGRPEPKPGPYNIFSNSKHSK